MGQEDFFSKQIDQAGLILRKLLAQLFNLKGAEAPNKVMEITNKSLNELGINLHQVLGTSADQFVQILVAEKKFNSFNLNSLSDIFYELGNMCKAKGVNDSASNFYEKALKMYEYLNSTETTYSLERHNRITKIKNMR